MTTASVSVGSATIVRAEKGKKGVGILDGGCFYAVAVPVVALMILMIVAR